MARLPRLTLANMPHHIIQRGNNSGEIFVDAQDRLVMLDLMREMARRFEVDVHAYVLMPNHFHLLLTPRTEQGVPQFMQAVGRSYVRYFNNRHGRTGTLWEGRYRCTVLQAEQWLMATMVSMDLNPVRDGLVQRAVDWPWSSYAHNAGLQSDALISPHALFWALGNTPFAGMLLMSGPWRPVWMPIPRRRSAMPHCVAGLWASLISLKICNKTERRVKRQKAGRPSARTASVHED